MYKDLKKILSCVPNSYKRKNLMNSLFLCANFTAQRASSMTSVKFDDINVTKNARGKDCIRIKFNVVKGKGKHAGIKKNIIVNEKMKICVSLMHFNRIFRVKMESILKILIQLEHLRYLKI